jgi:type II secretory pathway predicted ATPase ExeA
MYESHFGLRQRPFRSTPDLGAYYPANAHEDSLHLLRQAMIDDEPFALLYGEPGTGKTLVAGQLLGRLGDDLSRVFITNGHLQRRSDLLQAILYDLGLPYEGRGEQELRLAVTDRLLTDFGEGRRTVIVLDEAHHLPADLLEELRLLGNLETAHGRAVQTVLIAQPSILDTFQRPDLRALNQRLTAKAELGRLTPDESADYVLHHLRIAGARPEALVDDEALTLLARSSGGIPRVINQIAHLALTLTSDAGSGRVDAEGVLEALVRLGIEAAEVDTELGPVEVDPQTDAEPSWPPNGYVLPGPARSGDYGIRNAK